MTIIRSGGATWSVPAFVASRLAALTLPSLREQALAELVGVVLALRAADTVTESEAA